MKTLTLFLILGTTIDAQQNDPKKSIQPRSNISVAYASDYPSAVYIIQREDFSKSCGGVIINSEWIMTSQLCVLEAEEQNFANITISAGATYLGYGDTWHHAVEGHTTKEIGLLDYGGVGVIKVKPHFNFSIKNIKPAILASQELIPVPGDNVTVLAREHYISPPAIAELKKKSVQVDDITECNKEYKDNYVFDNSFFCTEGSKDEPLCLWGLTDPTFQDDIVVGLRILDFNCGFLPNVYIRVSTFREWILDKTMGPVSFCSGAPF